MKIAKLIFTICLAYLSVGTVASSAEDAERELPEWIDKIQTYCMVPLLPEDANTLNATVNGVWAGIGGTHPILPHVEHVPAVRERYGDDAEAFVMDSRAAGLRVCGVVNGLEGMVPLRETVPNLDEMACRKANGEPATVGDGMTLMCTNNPNWIQWELDHGKKGIDEGADLILLDTPMSSSFISGFLGAGFCDHCMADFRNHLTSVYNSAELQGRFGITEFDKDAIIARLSPFQTVTPMDQSPHVQTSPDALLFQEFIKAQEEASFRTRKALLSDLRQYADERGKRIAFTTNAADLGTQNPGGHWIRGIMFADLFDLFAYEQSNDPKGMFGSPLTRFPRGKWAAFHKLAHAIHKRRSPAVIHASNMGQLLMQILGQNKRLNSWMAAQVSEAYAANGSYILYQIGAQKVNTMLREKCWAKAVEHNGFILDHQDLYEGDLRSGSRVAFLFLLNERGRTIPSVFPSYLGLAQGFIEGNYPFDVLFAGDGHYVKDRLDSAQLQAYGTIIVPSPISPTENQKEVVQAFAKSGGVVVCQEPQLFGLVADSQRQADSPECWCASESDYGKGKVIVLSGAVTLTETHDVGTKFYRQYTDDLRKQVAVMAEDLGLTSLLQDHQDGLVSAFPIAQPDNGRLVVHLVNYDIDYDGDEVRTKSNLKLTVPVPSFLSGELAGVLYVLGKGQKQILPVNVLDETIRCMIPEMGMGAVLVIQSSRCSMNLDGRDGVGRKGVSKTHPNLVQ